MLSVSNFGVANVTINCQLSIIVQTERNQACLNC